MAVAIGLIVKSDVFLIKPDEGVRTVAGWVVEPASGLPGVDILLMGEGGIILPLLGIGCEDATLVLILFIFVVVFDVVVGVNPV